MRLECHVCKNELKAETVGVKGHSVDKKRKRIPVVNQRAHNKTSAIAGASSDKPKGKDYSQVDSHKCFTNVPMGRRI
jgi:hypothetical protein